MNPAYELLQKQGASNKQLYTLLRFACRCDHVTSLNFNSYESVTVFLSAKCATIRARSLSSIDASLKENYEKIAKEIEVDLEFLPVVDVIEPTDLLYINTPAEGNFRASELAKFAAQVKKYIILPNTEANGLQPSSAIKLADNKTPIGLVFGINHFLQTNDDWFILEHDDVDPGMTVLVNRRNVANAYS
jgi:hypothetical protein